MGVAHGGGSEWVMKLKLGFVDHLDLAGCIPYPKYVRNHWHHKMATRFQNGYKMATKFKETCSHKDHLTCHDLHLIITQLTPYMMFTNLLQLITQSIATKFSASRCVFM